MTSEGLGFPHRFVPAADPASAPTLLLLHGTGGSENDLLPLGRELAASLPGGANLLSPRGKVRENGMPRFFRRLREGVFDLEDLRFRAEELTQFVRAAAAGYGFDPERVIAAGYSNGANIAAAVLLLHPGVLQGAILFRAMVPIEPETLPSLSSVQALLSNGRLDPIVPRNHAERLAALLSGAGANVHLHWYPGGHELSRADLDAAISWLEKFSGGA